MAQAGKDRPIDKMMANADSTNQDYNNVIESATELAKSQVPGVGIEIATASSRSVTMTESFARPLVIGYVGFDMQILAGGNLGPPISTRAQLTSEKQLQTTSSVSLYRAAALAHMYYALKEIPGVNADRDSIMVGLDKLDRFLPERYPFTRYSSESSDSSQITESTEVVAGARITDDGFLAVVDYIGYAGESITALENYLDGAQPDAEKRGELESQLRSARMALDDLEKSLSGQPALTEAVNFVFFGE
jgi:hypothetical protein